ncbi:hypothetical protein KL928_000016 [Ogataea angusta]|uniref:Uncharacterized protein n=1 Tax=Pichia angusta TaxID=870730 RepID=A0AAN6I733_PICAN|nr:uncharacterized protein KL928_000016 [Ogataea angusta]KAG7821541.1 hypothetical protein KL928_000016 [Ogataea angusta]
MPTSVVVPPTSHTTTLRPLTAGSCEHRTAAPRIELVAPDENVLTGVSSASCTESTVPSFWDSRTEQSSPLRLAAWTKEEMILRPNRLIAAFKIAAFSRSTMPMPEIRCDSTTSQPGISSRMTWAALLPDFRLVQRPDLRAVDLHAAVEHGRVAVDDRRQVGGKVAERRRASAVRPRETQHGHFLEPARVALDNGVDEVRRADGDGRDLVSGEAAVWRVQNGPDGVLDAARHVRRGGGLVPREHAAVGGGQPGRVEHNKVGVCAPDVDADDEVPGHEAVNGCNGGLSVPVENLHLY